MRLPNRIDPNPHQIDAVIFALRMVREGGCILADEVGLGKTIEAGLVITQLLSEGYRRILVVLPKPLIGQWQNEMSSLFSINAREGGRDLESFEGNGLFLVGREFAGGEVGSEILRASEPFDLCVIDEAHEMFAGIYKRYSKDGLYKEDSNA
ncbi:MAG: SNF2-related protein, partial [Planctomycetota bacterium]|nr:SNF2-related protein [Planctomycetota bacterium]